MRFTGKEASPAGGYIFHVECECGNKQVEPSTVDVRDVKCNRCKKTARVK